MSVRNRVEVMHGVNLDQLGRRPANVYGELTFEQLEFRIDEYADELDLSVRFFQTNAEHEFVEHLHKLEGLADGVINNYTACRAIFDVKQGGRDPWSGKRCPGDQDPNPAVTSDAAGRTSGPIAAVISNPTIGSTIG